MNSPTVVGPGVLVVPNIWIMEVRDYIMKFPPRWRGVFAPLSKNHQPIAGADSWLLESREGTLACHSYNRSSSHSDPVDWKGFVDSLCEKEPTEVEGQLVFLPRILLFPVNIQRNTIAFLSQRSSEIPMPCLEKLLDSLRNCAIPDEWTKHHLRTMQDFVCRKQCQSAGPAGNCLSRLTRSSRGIFESVCRQVGDTDRSREEGGGFMLQFDWPPEASSSNQIPCQHSRCFVAETESLDTLKRAFVHPESIALSSKEGESKTEWKISTAVHSDSPEIIEIEDSPPSSPMEVEIVSVQNVPEKSSEKSPGAHETIDAVTMDKLTSLKAVLANYTSGKSISPESVKVLIECPMDQMEAACDILDLDSAPAAGLAALAQQLAGFSLELSHSSAAILARKCFGQQIQDLTQTAPRSLLTAVVSLAKAFPKPTIEGVLLPALAREGPLGTAGPHQCDLVVKVLKEALTNESQVYLLSKLLSVQTLHWSDEMTGLFQAALACKLELDNHTLETFVAALEHHGHWQRSCAKFAKLLLAVVNRFSKQISGASLAALQRLADANQTFLKKALLTAIKRVKG
ncbi:Fanconi anemia group E protein-like isoform X2 [Acanthaster planci]|uniref:Fanconi anemia group E protein-like isoform X2 n=1 Tax=Acanthaster planci TaxID=133434 RepID=A0A8B7XPM1_ACAPL|nr:Fanconi anemia group E protein-like isoform X2 [Acanthaster planci]